MEPCQADRWTESEAADADTESDNKPPVLDISNLAVDIPTFPCLPLKQSYVVPIATNSGHTHSMQSDNDLRTAGLQCKTLKQEDIPHITAVHGEKPTLPCLQVKQTNPAAIATDPCNENKNVLPTVHYKTLKQEDSPSIGTLSDDESIFPYLEVKQSFPAPITPNTSIQSDNDLPTVHCETIKDEDSRKINAAPGEESTFPYMKLNQPYSNSIATDPGIQSDNGLPTVHRETITQEDCPYISVVPGEESTFPYVEVNQSYSDSMAADPGIQSGNVLPTVHCETIKEEEDHNSHLCVHNRQKVFDSTESDNKLSIKWQPPLVCTECGKTFTHNQDLTLHLRIHYRKKSFECTLCERRFKRMDFLRKHLRIHKRRPYVCTFCEKRFSAKPSLMRHIRAFCRNKHDKILNTQLHKHEGQRPKSLRYMLCCRDFSRRIDRHKHSFYQNGRKPFHFVLCGRQFSCKEVLNKRLQSYGDKPFTCTICGEAVRGHLGSHPRIHSGEKPYTCTLCGKGFAEQGTLKTHLRVRSGEKRYKCTLCGKDFAEQGTLKTHLRVHSGEKRYKCTLCGKDFAKQYRLKRHLRIHSGEKPYKCTLCGQGFARQDILKTHLRVHSGEKPYKCILCGKDFAKRGNFDIHLRIHSGEKPYTCTLCGKNFTGQGYLKSHLRIHSGDKPYKCTLCGKSFAHQGSVKRHLRIHSGEKPYECTLCGKGFSKLRHLKSHLPAHTGKTHYECPMCEKSYSAKCKLNEHIRVHAGEKPYECSVCGEQFSSNCDLKDHISKHSRHDKAIELLTRLHTKGVAL